MIYWHFWSQEIRGIVCWGNNGVPPARAQWRQEMHSWDRHWGNDSRKDGRCDLPVTKNTPWTLAACSKHIMLEERSTSCNQGEKRRMKRNVWADVWIVFFFSLQQRKAGSARGCMPAVVIGPPVWSLALLFRLVYNVPEGVALSLLTQAILFSTWMLMLPLVVMCPL